MITDDDKNYWRNFIFASIAIAAGTAVANEVAKAVGDALRKRWNLDEHQEEEKGDGDKTGKV